jgi:hypothetical protein
LTLGLSRRPTFHVGQRVEVRGLYGLEFLKMWRKGVVVATEPVDGVEGAKASPQTPLVKLGEWDEYYVFDETKAVVAFKEVRNAYSGMSYEELLAEQARMDKQVIPPLPENVVCE